MNLRYIFTSVFHRILDFKRGRISIQPFFLPGKRGGPPHVDTDRLSWKTFLPLLAKILSEIIFRITGIHLHPQPFRISFEVLIYTPTQWKKCPLYSLIGRDYRLSCPSHMVCTSPYITACIVWRPISPRARSKWPRKSFAHKSLKVDWPVLRPIQSAAAVPLDFRRVSWCYKRLLQRTGIPVTWVLPRRSPGK